MCKLYVFLFICFNLTGLCVVNGFTQAQKDKILDKFNPTFLSCAAQNNVTQAQADTGRRTKNINSVSACFFTCIFKKIGVLKSFGSKEFIDPVYTLLLAKSLIPTINIGNAISIAGEVGSCAAAYSSASGSDNMPGCPKTSAFVNCAADARVLSNTITQAVNIK